MWLLARPRPHRIRKEIENAKDRRLEEGWGNKAQMGTLLKDS